MVQGLEVNELEVVEDVEVEVEEINNHMEDYITCACYKTS